MKHYVEIYEETPNLKALIDFATEHAVTNATASTSTTSSTSDEDSIPPIIRDLEKEFKIYYYDERLVWESQEQYIEHTKKVELKSQELNVTLYKDELFDYIRVEYDTILLLDIDERERLAKYKFFKDSLTKDYDREIVRERLTHDNQLR